MKLQETNTNTSRSGHMVQNNDDSNVKMINRSKVITKEELASHLRKQARMFRRDNLMEVVTEAGDFESLHDLIDHIGGSESWMKGYLTGEQLNSAIENIRCSEHIEKLYIVDSKKQIAIQIEEYEVYDYITAPIEKRILSDLPDDIDIEEYDLLEAYEEYDKWLGIGLKKLNTEKVLFCGDYYLVRSKTNPCHHMDSRKIDEILKLMRTYSEAC